MNIDRRVLPFILPILLIIVWYLITDGLNLVPYYILPSPLDVCNAALKLVANGKLLDHTISTLTKVFSGIILAAVVAIPLGIILGWYETLDEFTSLVISILRPIPPIAWIPFSILWFGIGLPSAVFVIFIGCVFSVLVYTIDGVKRTDKVLIEAAHTLGANNWDILYKVVLPSALPYIVSGLKVGVSIALMCTVSAEMIASSKGLGYMILTASQLFDPGTMVVGMVIIGIIGILFDVAFRKVQSKIFW
ncbi:ABC transporter permease [uncultured Methanobrevibacter sp.]|uniref:ABC transporter permease n=1 Tax=uncultured Methanobrevibacter sp. TaxID=253161 RepID=UPI0025D93FA0|nr:ABC transporter permease [uncultured Methanobrevibacter sp.]